MNYHVSKVMPIVPLQKELVDLFKAFNPSMQKLRTELMTMDLLKIMFTSISPA